MKTFYLVCFCCLIFACQAPRYSYVPPTLNTTAYSRAGEGQLGVQFGSPGIAAKGGFALTKNININAWGSLFPEQNNGYNSREAEFSIGFQTNPRKNKSATSFYLGMSTGSNEKDTIGLAGNFHRSFIQVQTAAFDQQLGDVYFDGYIGLRVNYLDYNGTKATMPLNDYLFYYEPYFGATIGGKNVRLELLQGLAIKNSGDWRQGVRIFPYFGSVGLLVKLRKK